MEKNIIKSAYEYEQSLGEVRMALSLVPGIIKALVLLFAFTTVCICLDIAVAKALQWYDADVLLAFLS